MLNGDDGKVMKWKCCYLGTVERSRAGPEGRQVNASTFRRACDWNKFKLMRTAIFILVLKASQISTARKSECLARNISTDLRHSLAAFFHWWQSLDPASDLFRRVNLTFLRSIQGEGCHAAPSASSSPQKLCAPKSPEPKTRSEVRLRQCPWECPVLISANSAEANRQIPNLIFALLLTVWSVSCI